MLSKDFGIWLESSRRLGQEKITLLYGVQCYGFRSVTGSQGGDKSCLAASSG